MPVDVNQKQHRAIVRATANATFQMSDIKHADEATVTGAVITQVMWTTDARVQVKRGANVVLTLVGTGEFDLRRMVSGISQDATANVVIETASAANCTVILELVKRY